MTMTARFHALDFVLFGITVAVSLAVGVYYAFTGGKQKTTSEYLLGNRRMKVLPVALSLLVTFQSAILMLGFPAEMYLYGSQYWLYTFSVIFANLISAQTLVPLFHPLKLTSIYEYLELRFKSKTVRKLGSFLGIMTTTWYSGIVLYAPALTLEAVTGFPAWSSVIVVASCGIIYTTIGGFKAVIWADAFQFLIMVAGMLAILIQGVIQVGGVGKAWDMCEKGDRINFFNFDIDPTTRHTFWALMIGGTIRKMGYNMSQASVQRISAMQTLREAKMVVMLAIPGFVLFGSLACLEGLLAYGYYATTQCDPLASEAIKSSNQIIPHFVMTLFHNKPGLPGLFLSSVFSASLSTYSSNLNSISAQVWEDFLKPYLGRVGDVKATILAKFIVVIFGAISIGLSFLIINIRGPISQIAASLLSSFGGALSGMFLLGALFALGNKWGAFGGGLTGFAFTLWISMGANFSPLTRRSPRLPSVGTAGCVSNATFQPYITNDTYHLNTYTINQSFISTEVIFPLTTPEPVTEITGLGRLYSLSYMWFDAVGILTTIGIGLLLSKIFSGEKRDKVEARLMIPLIANLCCCLPFGRKRRGQLNLKSDVQSEDNPMSLRVQDRAAGDVMEIISGDDEFQYSSESALTAKSTL